MQYKIRLLFHGLCWQCVKTKSFTFGCRFQSKCGFFIPCSCWWTNAILFWFFICSNAYSLLPSTANAKKNWITVVSPWAALQNNCEHFYSTHVSDNTLFLNTFSMEKNALIFLAPQGCTNNNPGQNMDEISPGLCKNNCTKYWSNHWCFLLTKNMCLNKLWYTWTFLECSNLFSVWQWHVFLFCCLTARK